MLTLIFILTLLLPCLNLLAWMPNPTHKPKVVDYFSLKDLNENGFIMLCHLLKSLFNIKYLEEFSSLSYISKLKMEFHNAELKLRNLLLQDLLWEDRHAIWNNKRLLIETNPWSTINKRCEMIRDGLSSSKIANLHSYVKIKEEKHFIEVKVANQLTQPIEVISLSIGKSSWNAGSIINSNSQSEDIYKLK